MNDTQLKIVSGMYAITIMAVLLCIVWYLGIDGTVTAAIIGIIGLIAGTVFGFAFNINKNIIGTKTDNNKDESDKTN